MAVEGLFLPPAFTQVLIIVKGIHRNGKTTIKTICKKETAETWMWLRDLME